MSCAVGAVLLTAGCSTDEAQPEPSPSTEPAPSIDVEADPADLPARADQSAEEAAALQAAYVERVRNFTEVESSSDQQLLAAAEEVCDLLDEGTRFDLAYPFASLDLAEGYGEEAPMRVTFAATQLVCPEHHAAGQDYAESLS